MRIQMYMPQQQLCLALPPPPWSVEVRVVAVVVAVVPLYYGIPKRVRFSVHHRCVLFALSLSSPTKFLPCGNCNFLIDHMLSYFLSGSDQGPTSTIDFTTMPSSVPLATTTVTTTMTNAPTSTTEAPSHKNKSYQNMTSTTTTENHYHMQPPPTPAVHFYSNSTPLSSNVHRSGNTPNDPTIPKATNSSNSRQASLQHHQHQQHIYPAFSSSTTTTQSQSSSSSSLSSLATNVQLYHQQLQMQRMLAGSGGGNSASSIPSYLPALSQQQSPNTLLYPQMLLYPPPIPSHGSGVSGAGTNDQQPQHSMNVYDGESPLSPAAMIGNGTPSQHENLFLPRSNSFYENASKKNHNETEITMGPPVSRQPSSNDMQSAMAGVSSIPGGYAWPPPGTMVSSSSPTMSSITTIPTLPFNMMAPFLNNPLTSSVHDPNGSSLLPNLQPFMYTTNTMQHRHEPTTLNSTIPLSSSSSSSPSPQSAQPVAEEESEEKRNKRLERNRESARKCRLKKKERLHTLGMQVTELHKKIEFERCTIIDNMVPILMQHCRQHEISNCIAATLNDGKNGNLAGYYNPLTEIIRGSGPSSTMMRSVLEFQYSTLKDITLPHHQKLLLWFTTQNESYFFIGKEQYYLEQQKKIKQQQQTTDHSGTKEEISQNVPAEMATSALSSASTGIRPNAIKISSKQIGEELTTGSSISNNSNDDSLPKKRQTKSNQGGNGGITSSAVYDGAKTWPLFCFELKLSVDQEERFIGKYKQIIADDDRQVKSNMNATSASTYRSLSYIREQMAIAVTTTENLGKAVGTLSHIIAQRDEHTYLNILHPQQVSRYYSWLSQHRQSIRRNMARHDIDVRMECVKPDQPTTALPVAMDTVPLSMSSVSASIVGTSMTISDSSGQGDSMSLHTISRRLSEVLQISSRQQYDKATST